MVTDIIRTECEIYERNSMFNLTNHLGNCTEKNLTYIKIKYILGYNDYHIEHYI